MAAPAEKPAPRARRPSTMELPSGLQHYTLGKTIGEGAYAKVKIATNNLTGEQVAIKIVMKNAFKSAADAVRSVRERQLLALLRHPYIVRLHEVIETEDKIFMVMDWCANGDLFGYIVNRNRLKEKRARHLFRQLLSAIGYCHANYILHRDIKPENILLSGAGDIQVADFGFAQTFNDEGKLLETFCGSYQYASPEMVNGVNYRGPEVDIWSLGVLLFTMVTGTLPFDRPNSHLQAVFERIAKADFVAPSYLSPECRSVLDVTLRVDANERIKLADLLQHPWVCGGGLGPPELHLPPRPARSPDPDVLAALITEHHLALDSDFATNLENGVVTFQTSAYHLVAATRVSSAQAIKQAATASPPAANEVKRDNASLPALSTDQHQPSNPRLTASDGSAAPAGFPGVVNVPAAAPVVGVHVRKNSNALPPIGSPQGRGTPNRLQPMSPYNAKISPNADDLESTVGSVPDEKEGSWTSPYATEQAAVSPSHRRPPTGPSSGASSRSSSTRRNIGSTLRDQDVNMSTVGPLLEGGQRSAKSTPTQKPKRRHSDSADGGAGATDSPLNTPSPSRQAGVSASVPASPTTPTASPASVTTTTTGTGSGVGAGAVGGGAGAGATVIGGAVGAGGAAVPADDLIRVHQPTAMTSSKPPAVIMAEVERAIRATGMVIEKSTPYSVRCSGVNEDDWVTIEIEVCAVAPFTGYYTLRVHRIDGDLWSFKNFTTPLLDQIKI